MGGTTIEVVTVEVVFLSRYLLQARSHLQRSTLKSLFYAFHIN